MESNMGVSQKYFLIELAYHPEILLLFLSEEKEITNLEQYMHPCGGLVVKNLLAKAGFDPLVRKIPWRRKWQPTPLFLLGKSHGGL